MNKILLTCGMICLLSACSSETYTRANHTANQPKPATKYKISDELAKKWVIEKNKAQQCLFPKESNRIAATQPFLYQMAIYNHPLLQVIGEQNYQILSQSPSSQQYAAAKLRKFNHTKKAKFGKSWCNELRKEYGTLVKLAQAQPQATKTLENKVTKKKNVQLNRQAIKIKLPPIPNVYSESDILDEEITTQDTAPMLPMPPAQSTTPTAPAAPATPVTPQKPETTPTPPAVGPAPSSYDGDEQIRINNEPFKSEVIHF